MMKDLVPGNLEPHFVNISPRTVLCLSGPDRLRFLNGQVTQDVHLASRGQAVYSCILNAKGQLDAVCHIREHGDSYLIDAPIELRESLRARLDRYIIADDVELTDESDNWVVSHLLCSNPPDCHDALFWTTKRLASTGFDLFSRSAFSMEDVKETTLESYEMDRTLQGIPQWGAELTVGLLPPEAGLEKDAISYTKGCYVGQEVISRMKHAGKVNRHLVKLFVPADTTPPCPLYHEGAEAGEVTTVIPNPSEGEAHAYALGFRRRKFNEINVFDLPAGNGSWLSRAARIRNDDESKP